MAAKIKSGYYFSQSGEVWTADKLYRLVEGPNSPADKTVVLLSKMDSTDLASNAGLIVSGAVAPSNTKNIWFDTELNLIRIHDGTDWQPAGRGVVLTNASGGDLALGEIVVVSTGTDKAFTITTSEFSAFTIGALAENINNGAKGVVLTKGLARVSFREAGLIPLGSTMGTSSTAGKARWSVSPTLTGIGFVVDGSSTTTSAWCFLYGAPARLF